MMADLAQKENDAHRDENFCETEVRRLHPHDGGRAGLAPSLGDYRSLLAEAFGRTGKAVRLLGVGVRFAPLDLPDAAQLPLL